MPASVLDLEVGDTTDPYVPTAGVEEAPTFARPSSAYPLACPDDDSNPTTLFDRDEVPTMRGREARSYAAYEERTTTPARRSQERAIARLQLVQRSVPAPHRERVTPHDLEASYEAAIRRFR